MPRLSGRRLAFPGIVLIFGLTGSRALATTYYSVASGPWTSSSTWSLSSGGAAISSGYPGAGDDVVIEGGYTVTIATGGVENLQAASVMIGGSNTAGTLSYPTWNATSTLTISGDLTIGGTGASASGRLYYATWGLTITCARLLKGAGTATRTNPLQQDFTFTGSFTLPTGFNQFRNFIVSGGTVTLSENITTNGSTSPTISAGSTLDMKTYAMTIGGYKNFNINGVLIVGGNSGGFGNSNFPTSFTNLSIGSNSTVEYTYAGNQSIYPTTYQNLVLSGSGTKTIEGRVSGITLIDGGSGYYCDATISFTGGGGSGAAGTGSDAMDATDSLNNLKLTNGGNGYTSVPTVVISGDCGGSGAIATATVVTDATVNGTLTMQGTAVLSGTSPTYGSNAALLYAGSAMQTTGAEFPSTWTSSGQVGINNSNGVTLAGPRTINSLLHLYSGVLTTSTTNSLTISNTSASAILGGSATTYIDGPVTVNLASGLTGSTSYSLPIGKGSTYLPLVLVNPVTGSGTVTVTAEAFDTGSGGSAGTGILSVSQAEYWSLATTGNFTGSSVSLTRQTPLGGIDLVGQSSTVNGSYNSIGGTISGTSITNTSDIGAVSATFLAMGSDYMTLPVTIASINAFEQQGDVEVRWTSYSETGTDHFEIEKSADGRVYQKAGEVAATGNGNAPVDYSWLDTHALRGDNYYRVKAVGRNGDIGYTRSVRVSIAALPGQVRVSPNPVTGNTIRLTLSGLPAGVYQVVLYNTLGARVFYRDIRYAGGVADFQLRPGKGFGAGLYRLQVGNGKLVVVRSVVR